MFPFGLQHSSCLPLARKHPLRITESLLVVLVVVLAVFCGGENGGVQASNPPDFITKAVASILNEQSPVLSAQQNSTFLYPQVVLQYYVNNTNASHPENTTVEETFSYFDFTTNKTILLDQNQIKGSTNTTLILSPTTMHLTGGVQRFNSTFLLSKPTNKTSVTVVIRLSMLQTQMISAATSTIQDTFPVCPQIRYFYVDVPNDGNAYNVTLSTSVANISQVFSNIYFRHNATPDILNSMWDFKEDNVTVLEEEDGYSFGNLIHPGKWWIAFQCRSSNPSPNGNKNSYNYDITAGLSQTCALECFKLNHGFCSGEPAFCDCYTWWQGANCESLFSGVYVLMVLAVVFGISFILGGIYGVYRLQKKLQKKRGIGEREEVPLLLDKNEE